MKLGLALATPRGRRTTCSPSMHTFQKHTIKRSRVEQCNESSVKSPAWRSTHSRCSLFLNSVWLWCLGQLLGSHALVCPVYSSRQTNAHEHRFIRHCHSRCSFSTVPDKHNACLGIYSNVSGVMFIKQLGIIHSDRQCALAQHCVLEADPLNSQIFSCCCSTDNCTLKWTRGPTSTTSLPPTSTEAMNSSKIVILEQEYFSQSLFVSVAVVMLFVLVIIIALALCKSFEYQPHEKETRTLIKSLSTENLFFSAEQLLDGKSRPIYKALWNNASVALKTYPRADSSIWENEAALLKSVNHEAIIKFERILALRYSNAFRFRLLSEGEYGSNLYLVLPFYDKGSLQSYLRTANRTLSIHQCVGFIRSIASAVSYLHVGQDNGGMNIVHRDIKSSNVLVNANELSLCLTDFGTAMALPRILSEKDFVQIGTLRYMAPELLEGVIAHTHEALYSVDSYALALVMWEIVAQCDVHPTTGRRIHSIPRWKSLYLHSLVVAYRPPYDEYLTNLSSFATQLYDIVVIRRLRPSLPHTLPATPDAAVCLLPS